MNKIINEFILAGDKSMLKMNLKQLGFTYSACGPVTKNKERIQKLKRNRRFQIYLLQLIIYKACFQRDKADGDSNDLQEGIAIANIPHYNGC